MKGYIFFIILIAYLLIAGCTTQSVSQNNVSQPNEPSLLKTIALTQTTLVSENQSKDITYTDDNAHWNLYTDSHDHFRIYKANDWIVAPMDSPYREPTTDINGTTEQMLKQVWIYPPRSEGKYLTSGNGMVLISGYTHSDRNKTFTSKQLNDQSFDSFVSQMQKEKRVTNVHVDNKDYLINGNAARHFTYDDLDGINTHDVYLIVHNNSFYTVQWAGNKTFTSTASKIMRTFDPY